MRFKIGSDPEFMVLDEDGKYISIIDKLGGTKKNPLQLGIGHVQEDNVNGEFNIPPASTEDEFNRFIETMLQEVALRLWNEHKLFISGRASAEFDRDQLMHPDAVIAGCDKDYSAWTGKENPTPCLLMTTLRSAGGHLHFSWDAFDGYDSKLNVPWNVRTQGQLKSEGLFLGRMLDLVLGTASVIEDKDIERKKLYGRAGAIRPTSYGIEYRTLSNYWIFTENSRRKIYRRAKFAIENYRDFIDILDPGSPLAATVQETINTNNIVMAQNLLSDLKEVMEA